MEVDLGATEALKITDGQQQTQSETTIQKKSRLGPDGKPWRGRKNRRGSDDIARDKWVDEFLHENRRMKLLHPLFFLLPQISIFFYGTGMLTTILSGRL